MSATLAPLALTSRRCFGTIHGTAYGLADDGGVPADGRGPPWTDGGLLRLAGPPEAGSGVKVSAERDGRACAERSYAEEMV